MNENNGNGKRPAPMSIGVGWLNLDAAQDKLMELFRGMVEHNGISKLQIEVNPLKKGRKNVVLSSGMDYHFVLKPVPAPVQKPVGEGNPGN